MEIAIAQPLTLPSGRSALPAYRAEAARIGRLPESERQPANMALNRASRELVDSVAMAELQRAANAPEGRPALDAALLWFWFNLDSSVNRSGRRLASA